MKGYGLIDGVFKDNQELSYADASRTSIAMSSGSQGWYLSGFMMMRPFFTVTISLVPIGKLNSWRYTPPNRISGTFLMRKPAPRYLLTIVSCDVRSGLGVFPVGGTTVSAAGVVRFAWDSVPPVSGGSIFKLIRTCIKGWFILVR